MQGFSFKYKTHKFTSSLKFPDTTCYGALSNFICFLISCCFSREAIYKALWQAIDEMDDSSLQILVQEALEARKREREQALE